MAGLKLQVRIQGGEDVRARLEALAKQVPQAVAASLYSAGVAVWADAKTRAPLEYGALRNSAFVTLPTSFEPIVSVGFGVPYAAYQHEGNFNHPRGGQRHYLQQALGLVTLEKLAAHARALVERQVDVSSIPALAPTTPMVLARARGRAAGRRGVARLGQRNAKRR